MARNYYHQVASEDIVQVNYEALAEYLKEELPIGTYQLSVDDILSPVMIDRLHFFVRIEKHSPVADTFLVELDNDNDVVGSMQKSVKLSHTKTREVSLWIRSKNKTTLEVITSPNKYLFGHNLYGSSDIHFLLRETLRKALTGARRPDLLPLVKDAEIVLLGVDINSMLNVNEVGTYLKLLPSRVHTNLSITANSNTVYLGNHKTSDYAFRIYDKYQERANKKLLGKLSHKDQKYSFNKLRLELILHYRELEHLKLVNPKSWNNKTALEIYEKYQERFEFIEEQTDDLSKLDYVEAGLYCRWKYVGDPIEAIIPNKNTRSKYRKSIKEKMGIDIAEPYSPDNDTNVKLPNLKKLTMNSIPQNSLEYELASTLQWLLGPHNSESSIIVPTNSSNIGVLPIGMYDDFLKGLKSCYEDNDNEDLRIENSLP